MPKVKEKLVAVWRSAGLTSNVPCYLGALTVLAMCIFYIAAGGSAIVSPHDQLDQFYMNLYVEHFGDGFAPELMEGVPLSQIQSTNLLFVPLYFLVDSAHAYLISYAIVMIVSYVGMVLLCMSLGVRQWVSVLVSLAFALLPFFCTYCLSIMGIPLLVWSILKFWRDQSTANVAIMTVVASIFAIGSGLVLIGYAVIIVLLVAAIVSCIKGKNRRRTIGLFLILGWLCLLYVLAYSDLFTQFFSNEASVASQREEYVNASSSVSFGAIVSFLQDGQEHGVSNQIYIFYFCLVVGGIALGYLLLKSRFTDAVDRDERLCKLIVALMVLVVAIACFYVFFHSHKVTEFRNTLPGFLRSFQFDRFYLFYPTLWYLLAAACTELLLRLASSRLSRVLSIGAFALVFVLTLSITMPANDIFETMEKKIDPSFKVTSAKVTWDEFFGQAVFNEIKEEIPGIEHDGKTVSVGLFPSIALYNGFSCLDGYLANYSLEYKHKFEEVIEDEIDKSSYYSRYFRTWGNRCYVFSAEHGSFFTLKNSDALILDLSINTEKLMGMGCKYVLAALPIGNAEELHLNLRGEFEDEGVPYKIWVYEIEGS